MRVTFRGPTTGTVKYPKFLDATGLNSFAYRDGASPTVDSTADGICQVCHTLTTHWRADGSGADHNSGARCTTCHPHTEGFKALGCDLCHGYPPSSVPTLVFKDKDGNTVTSGSASAGAHVKHVAKFAQCTTCHTGGMTSAVTGDYQINIGFNLSGDLGGNYDGNLLRGCLSYSSRRNNNCFRRQYAGLFEPVPATALGREAQEAP